MFYKNKCFNSNTRKKFREYYKNKPHLYKKHAKSIENGNNKYFEKANYVLNHNKNRYLKFVERNKKYDYEDYFSYLEKDGKVIILKMYCKNTLERIVFFEPDTEEYYAYSVYSFKQTGILIMADASNNIGTSYYNDGWNKIYSHYQRLQNGASLKILKSFAKFKYLPIERFEKINYFLLLIASDEMIYNYELLLKFGATKLATNLLFERLTVNREFFTKNKELLLLNRSYNYITRKDTKRKEKVKALEYDELLKKQAKYWTYNNFIIRTPYGINDVKKEAKELNHCLYSNRTHYIGGMVNKKRIILFVRDGNKPKEPFYTVEINNDGVVQVRTKNNATNEKMTHLVENFYKEYRGELFA